MIVPQYILTVDQLTDLFTKALFGDRILFLLSKLNVLNLFHTFILRRGRGDKSNMVDSVPHDTNNNIKCNDRYKGQSDKGQSNNYEFNKG